jgi:hypothetical protein
LGFIFLCINKQTYDFFPVRIFQSIFKTIIAGYCGLAGLGFFDIMVVADQYQP